MKKKITAAIFFIESLLLLTLNITLKGQTPDWNGNMNNANANFWQINNDIETYFQNNPQSGVEEGEENSYENFKRWQWFWQGRVDATGNFNTAQQNILNYMTNANCAQSVSANWKQMGMKSLPSQNLGIVVCLKFDTYSDPTFNTAYAGTNASGVWKSTDAKSASPHWQCLQDANGLPGCGVVDLVIDYSNPQTFFAAATTGSNYRGYGFGVLKSTDGGQTWNTTGLNTIAFPSAVIGKIMMHPTNPNILWALSPSDVYYTTDAGATWCTIFTNPILPNLGPFNNSNYLIDMEIEPGNTDVIYVSCIGYGDYPPDGIANVGARMWKVEKPALPCPAQWNSTDITYFELGPGISNYSSINFATDPSSNTFLYAEYVNDVWQPIPLNWSHQYRLNKLEVATQNWTYQPTVNGFAGNFIISPADNNIMYCGGLTALKSVDAGLHWNAISIYGTNGTIAEHADCRSLFFETSTVGGLTDILWMSNDGGISRGSAGSGNFTWTNQNGIGLDITQFYALGGIQKYPDILYGGTQDNGVFEFKNGSYRQFNLFPSSIGDGGECIIDPQDPGHLAGALNNRIEMMNNGNFSSINFGTNFRLDFPFEADPINTARIYAGPTHTDGLMAYDPNWTLPKLKPINDPAFTLESVGDIAVSKSNPDRMYFGSHYPFWGTPVPALFRIDDLQTALQPPTIPAWIDITPYFGTYSPCSDSQLKDILVHPTNPDQVWCCFMNFNPIKIISSSNAGVSWTDITYNLPNLPASCLEFDKTTGDLYAGTDAGVFILEAGTTVWKCFNTQLPVCIITDLEINYCNNKIRAATYGRGIWESDLPHAGYVATIAPVITGPALDCETNTTFTVTNPQAGLIYEWYAVDADGNFVTLIPNGISVNIDFPDGLGGTVTCTAIDPTTGCGSSTVFSLMRCCIGTDGEVNALTNITDWSGCQGCPFVFINTGTGNTIAFNGTIHVDADLFIYNSDVLLGPDTKFIGDPGVDVSITSSHLHTCNREKMWDGFYISDNTRQIFLSNNIIEDAKTPFVSTTGGNIFSMSHNIYNACYKGVAINPTQDPATNFRIENSDFICVDPSVISNPSLWAANKTTLILPYKGQLPYCGIYLNDVRDIEIGHNTNHLLPNTFFNLQRGIFATTNSTAYLNTLIVHNCDFKNMTIIPTDKKTGFNGTAIAVSNVKSKLYPYTVTVGGYLTGSTPVTNPFKCTFNDCLFNGIKITGNNISDISQNYFNHMGEKNVFIEKSTGYSVSVTNNMVDNFNVGIFCYNLVSTAFEISHNTFRQMTLPTSYTNFSGCAINVQNPVSAVHNTTATKFIRNNIMYNARIGVYVNNVPGFWIRANNVTFDFPQNYVLPAKHLGIWVTNSSRTIVDSINVITRMNSITTFAQRTMITGIQLELDDNSLVSDNHMYFLGTGIRAYYSNLLTPLECNEMTECIYGMDVNGASLSQQGNVNDAWHNQWNGGYTTTNYKINGYPTGIIDWYHEGPLNSGSTNTNTLSPSPHQSSQINDFDNNNATIVCMYYDPGGSREQEFVDEVNNGDLEYNQYESEYRYHAYQLAYELMREDTALNLDSMYQVFYDSLRMGNIGRFNEIRDNIAHGLLDDARDGNDLIVSENEPEENKKFTNHIYLYKISMDIVPDSLDTVNLNYLAETIPMMGGEGVYDARADLFKEVHIPELNLRIAGGTPADTRPVIPEEIYAQNFKLYPNPASNTLNVEYILSSNETGVISIVDILGREVLKKPVNINLNAVEISIAGLSDGLFTAKYLINGKLKTQKKFSVLK